MLLVMSLVLLFITLHSHFIQFSLTFSQIQLNNSLQYPFVLQLQENAMNTLGGTPCIGLRAATPCINAEEIFSEHLRLPEAQFAIIKSKLLLY